MRTQHILAFLGAGVLSIPVFAAPNNLPAPGALGHAAATQHGQYTLTEDQAEDMQSVFRLADGRKLKVSHQQSKLYIELDGKREALQQVGPDQFVSHDTGTRITFNQVPFADAVVVDQAAR